MKKVHIIFHKDMQHFCYVDREVYDAYRNKVSDFESLTISIARWAKSEFGIELKERRDVYELKSKIIKKYDDTLGKSIGLSPTPPNTDKYGWVRRWVHTKMLEEK